MPIYHLIVEVEAENKKAALAKALKAAKIEDLEELVDDDEEGPHDDEEGPPTGEGSAEGSDEGSDEQ